MLVVNSNGGGDCGFVYDVGGEFEGFCVVVVEFEGKRHEKRLEERVLAVGKKEDEVLGERQIEGGGGGEESKDEERGYHCCLCLTIDKVRILVWVGRGFKRREHGGLLAFFNSFLIQTSLS